MIKTSSNTYNQINSIIKDYIENDRFYREQEYADLEESLMYALSKKKPLFLIVSLDENKLKLINHDSIHFYKKNTKGNDIILGYYSYCILERDFNYDIDLLFKNSNELKDFVKSDVFKNRLLDIFSEYNIEKMNGEFNKINALEKLNISINEASLSQKIYCYFESNSNYKLQQNLSVSINFELEKKSEEEKRTIKMKLLEDFIENNLYGSDNYQNIDYYIYNRYLTKHFFEKTDNKFDILLITSVYCLENLYNNQIGDLNTNFSNKKINLLELKSYNKLIYNEIESFLYDNRYGNRLGYFINTSKITNDEKRQFLRLLGINNFSNFNIEDDYILSFIKYLDNDYIYTLKYNNNNLLENSGLEKFYTDSLFEEVSSNEVGIHSSINLLQVPTYVKELYIHKNEYIKFKSFLTILNKDIKSIIPETTKIIFVEDISAEDFESRLV